MPVFYYHHQIPIKIVHGYELKPFYHEKSNLVVPLKHSHPFSPQHFHHHLPPQHQQNVPHLPSKHISMPQHIPNHIHHHQNFPQKPQQVMYVRPVGVQTPPPVQKQVHYVSPRPGLNTFISASSNIDDGFQPIVGHTFNDHNVDAKPHNYGYVRQYIDNLKQRQKDLFANHPEVNYFQQREHELGQMNNNIKNSEHQRYPNNHVYKVTDDVVDDDDDSDNNSHQKHQVESNEENHYQSNQHQNKNSLEENHQSNFNPQDISHETPNDNYEDEVEGNEEEEEAEEEKKTHESANNVIPIKVYSQLRHTDNTRKVPRPFYKPNIKEKLSTGKTHILYKEEGYEDNNYDHLDSEKHDEDDSYKNKRKKYYYGIRVTTTSTTVEPETSIESRKKRDTNVVEKLPIEKVVEQLSEQLSEDTKNSTEKMTAEAEALRIASQAERLTDLDQLASPTQIFPTIVEAKINRYSNIKDSNNDNKHIKYKSRYRSKPSIRCGASEIPNLNEKSFNGTIKKRGGHLGEKLNCLKTKYFGKNPFQETFFKEPVNVSDVVYDDIMRHINGKKSNLKKRKVSNHNISVSKKTNETKSFPNSKNQATKKPNEKVFSPLVFPTDPTGEFEPLTVSTDEFGPPTSTLALSKIKQNESNKIHSSIFDISPYYPKPFVTSKPTIITTTPEMWKQISFTTSRPVFYEQVPQHSRPFRTFSRPSKRWNQHHQQRFVQYGRF